MGGGIPIYPELLVIIEEKNSGRFPRTDPKQVQFPPTPSTLRNDSRTVRMAYGIVRVLDNNPGPERVPILVNPSCDAQVVTAAAKMEKVNRLSRVQVKRHRIEPTFGGPFKATGGQGSLRSETRIRIITSRLVECSARSRW
jgi:hypothetical protein